MIKKWNIVKAIVDGFEPVAGSANISAKVTWQVFTLEHEVKRILTKMI